MAAQVTIDEGELNRLKDERVDYLTRLKYLRMLLTRKTTRTEFYDAILDLTKDL